MDKGGGKTGWNLGTLVPVDQLPLEIFVGPARLFDAQGRDIIPREVFAGLDGKATPRVLVRTSACDKSVFPRHIPTPRPEVPAWLGAQGVCLIGLDLPSVDQVDSKDAADSPRARCGQDTILENLDLRPAPVGTYELIVLPLGLVGADGSPVRAVLVERG